MNGINKVVVSLVILLSMLVIALGLVPWFVDTVNMTIGQTEGYPLLGILLRIPNPIEELVLQIIVLILTTCGIVRMWK
jgi:hypothetical protein